LHRNKQAIYMQGVFMLKLVKIVAALSFASTAAAYAAGTNAFDAVGGSPLGAAKISSSFDSVAGSSQSPAMVKVGLNANARGRSADPVVATNAPLGGVADATDDMGSLDGRAVLAGLALMGVIALRRIRNN